MSAYTRVCPECGVTFQTSDHRKVRCSRACLCRVQARLFANRVDATCEVCGAAMQIKPCHVGKKRYCSRACTNAARTNNGHVTALCKVCGKPFTRLVSQAGDFCSHACRGVDARTRVPQTCEICGKAFEVEARHAATTRFCSTGCMGVSKQRRIIVACAHCGAECVKHRTRADGPRFCSIACRRVYWASHILPNMHREETIPEGLVRKALDTLGIPYEQERPFDWYVLDFYLPDRSLTLEVDGVYWHENPKQRAHDHRRDAYCLARGVRTIRISDTDILHAANLCTLITDRLAGAE